MNCCFGWNKIFLNKKIKRCHLNDPISRNTVLLLWVTRRKSSVFNLFLPYLQRNAIPIRELFGYGLFNTPCVRKAIATELYLFCIYKMFVSKFDCTCVHPMHRCIGLFTCIGKYQRIIEPFPG